MENYQLRIENAFRLGIREAQEQGGDLSSGMTYDDVGVSEAYDVGATVGEWVEKKVPLAEVLAAALDLLAALKALMDHRETPIHSPEGQQARAVIARAERKQR